MELELLFDALTERKPELQMSNQLYFWLLGPDLVRSRISARRGIAAYRGLKFDKFGYGCREV